MEFRVAFGAEDEARLAPCEDDKPKDTEIAPIQAGSGYSLSAVEHNKKTTLALRRLFFCYDPYGIRTHVIAVKGRCLNHLTKGPYIGQRMIL